MRAVARAVRAGLLPPVKTKFCVDCGHQAEAYDHRDYNKPLDVAPVCRGCNIRRGSALPEMTSADGGEYKRDWIKNVGKSYGTLGGGEGYSPLEQKVVETQEVCDAIWHEENPIRALNFPEKRRFHGSIRQTHDGWGGRFDFFASHDPWCPT